MEKIDEIRKLNNEIIKLRDEVSTQYNEVNHPIWPVVASMKKKRKKYFWFLVFSLCALFCVILWILLFEIVNEYWIGGSIGLTSAIIIYFLVRLIIVLVKYKRLNEEWQKALIEPNKKNDRLNELYKEAVLEMKEFLKNYKSEEELNEIGDKYDDIYQYYQACLDENSL